MKKQLIIVFTILILIIGCKQTQEVKKELVTSENLVTAEPTKPLTTKPKIEVETIVEKYWKLKMLGGKEIVMGENQQKEIYFMLKITENKVTGFGGCNAFFGSYQLEKGNRIKFNQMAATEMYCEEFSATESEFMQVFSLADNYNIKDDVLFLNIGKRAPLAVFEAIYF